MDNTSQELTIVEAEWCVHGGALRYSSYFYIYLKFFIDKIFLNWWGEDTDLCNTVPVSFPSVSSLFVGNILTSNIMLASGVLHNDLAFAYIMKWPCKFSNHLYPQKLLTILLTIFLMMYIISLWLILSLEASTS